jgi:hypothetical protein
MSPSCQIEGEQDKALSSAKSSKVLQNPQQNSNKKWLKLRSSFWSSVLGAAVSVKAFLRHAVEGEGSDGALQARSNYAPRAMRATPASEILVFGPDHVSCHRYTYICGNSTEGWLPREARGTADNARSSETWTAACRRETLSHGTKARQSN